MAEEDLVEGLTRTGFVELASLTDEELESIRADEGTPFRPAEPPEVVRSLDDETRRAVLTTALRSLVVRGLIRQPSDEELAKVPSGGTLNLDALGDLDTILSVRRGPTSVVFVGQPAYLAAMHGFREGPSSGFLQERIDDRGFHHFTLRTVDNAVEALAQVADPQQQTFSQTPSGEPRREIPDDLARALREFAPGVTRIDAYHTRPAGTRRMQVSIVVRQGETSIVRSAFGVAPEPPQVLAVNKQGLREALRAVLCDEDEAAVQPDDVEEGSGADGQQVEENDPAPGGARYQCPVCGYPDLIEPPYTAESGASYEICPSCGFEFGYDDEAGGVTFEEWRQKWIDGGMKWWSSGRKRPPGWDPRAQLESLDKG